MLIKRERNKENMRKRKKKAARESKKQGHKYSRVIYKVASTLLF